MNVKRRISALRKEMIKQGISAYLVPSGDAHMDEYVPLHWRRREWMSGFSGSAGELVVTLKQAALWTDSRYFIQAENQLSGSGIKLMKIGEPKTPDITAWLGQVLPSKSKVGVDPRLVSINHHYKTSRDLASFNIQLVSIEQNLVDQLWSDQPEATGGPIEVHPTKYAGETLRGKLIRLRKSMSEAGAVAHVISALDAIAWLYNIRGTDVENNPYVIAYAIVTPGKAVLYVDLSKVGAEVQKAFKGVVSVKSYDAFRDDVRRLSKTKTKTGKVWLDPASTSWWIADLLGSRPHFVLRESPIVMFKAVKNRVEIGGAKAAHVRDGVAMVRFLTWLHTAVRRQHVTEISLAEKLEEFRELDPMYRGPSFDTIAGYAGHGAIIHYSASKKSSVRVKPKGILLLDSGGQYLDGTTDITRTICLSRPTPQQKEQYTRVLKGHLALLLTPFPVGTSGKQIDTLAREALWRAGLNYGHGTGHGVGSYLGVHEGPQSISPVRDTGVPLRSGMVCSNEPGYYEPGKYGFRIENLVYVTEDPKHRHGQFSFLMFENLTMCPIDTTLVDTTLLTAEERRFLNAYHATVKKVLSPHLDSRERTWLARATKAV